MATGSLTIKRGRYWAVISTYDDVGTKRERRQKWIDLEIPAKGSKKAAKQKLNDLLETYDEDQKLNKTSVLDVMCSYTDSSIKQGALRKCQ